MPPVLPSIDLKPDPALAKHFMLHQIHWIEAEDAIHAQHKQAFAIAEKSVRIGWTYADAFKNVRKRLRFKNRHYLFATKDYPSALEYIRVAYHFTELFNFTRYIVSHGEESINVPRLDSNGRSTPFNEEIKVGVIKFDNGSRIIAFSANPQAMAVYGGDVGLDEFARHPNPQLLWETAQGRITWGYDIAVWSAHCGDDTLFYVFTLEAAAGKGPWNLHYRVTLPDAIQFGLLDRINSERGTKFTPEQFIADCKARSGQDHIFQQTYMCNPVPGGAAIVDWPTIERCRSDYSIERVHLESPQITERFGSFEPHRATRRESDITNFIHASFPNLFNPPPVSPIENRKSKIENFRLGFDVAASGQGDLAVIYIDEANGPVLTLRALFTCRTEDWHFLETALFCFLRGLRSVQAAGDETGLGRQICWKASQHFGTRFIPVNFATKKHDLAFALMNQLSVAEKRFPRSEPDIAADYFALRKSFVAKKWVFTEGRNNYNSTSHCDIAWAGALSTEAHSRKRALVWAYSG